MVGQIMNATSSSTPSSPENVFICMMLHAAYLPISRAMQADPDGRVTAKNARQPHPWLVWHAGHFETAE